MILENELDLHFMCGNFGRKIETTQYKWEKNLIIFCIIFKHLMLIGCVM